MVWPAEGENWNYRGGASDTRLEIYSRQSAHHVPGSAMGNTAAMAVEREAAVKVRE